MARASAFATAHALSLVVVVVGGVGVGASSGCSKSNTSLTDAAPVATLSAATSAARDAAVTRDAGDASDVPAGPLNVLLITIDSLRADMPWTGYPRPIATRLAKLYKRSVAYSHAYSTSSFTSKSIPGLLTGRYPSELLRTGNFFTKYLEPKDFVCTTLAAEDIPCVASHAHAYFGKGQSGFESGYRAWQLVPNIPFNYETDPYVTSEQLTKLAIETLDKTAQERGNRPFFAWFHYMDPHDQYQSHPESPHWGKQARDLYDEEVFFTDHWIGKLLDWESTQPWAARTAIIVTADHGEAFGEHGMSRHAHEVWEELVHVPMFFLVPGVAPRVIETPRSAVDIAPTYLELLGSKTPVAGLDGTSLVAELRSPANVPPVARDVIVDLPEDEYNERRRALIHGTTKLIAFGNDVRYSLFDLEADPHESDDLVRKKPELAAEMKRLYKEASQRIKESPPRGGIPSHAR